VGAHADQRVRRVGEAVRRLDHDDGVAAAGGGRERREPARADALAGQTVDPRRDLAGARGALGRLDLEGEVPGARRSSFGIRGERARQHVVERGGRPRRDRAGRRDLAREHHPVGRGVVFAAKEAAPGQRFPEDDARRVDVDGARRAPQEQLLGRHVRELPLDPVVARDLATSARERDAEIEQARDALEIDEHVLRGHVAVDQAERLAVLRRLVGGVQPVQELHGDRAGDRGRDTLLTSRGELQERVERLPPHEMHDDVELAALGDDVDDLHHVRVPNELRDPRLVLERARELRVTGPVGVQLFDRDEARHLHGAKVRRDMHRGHPGGRDLVRDLVPPADVEHASRRAHRAHRRASRPIRRGCLRTMCGSHSRRRTTQVRFRRAVRT